MDDNIDGTPSGCWEIDDFIIRNDKDGFLITRIQYAKNYFNTLKRLYNKHQILIQRDDNGKIIGVCGWARINKSDEGDINKITWCLPRDITTGDNLYIVFCIISSGSIHKFRGTLCKAYGKEINEVFWFNSPTRKFIRRKNVLKEKTCNKTAVSTP